MKTAFGSFLQPDKSGRIRERVFIIFTHSEKYGPINGRVGQGFVKKKTPLVIIQYNEPNRPTAKQHLRAHPPKTLHENRTNLLDS